MVPVNYLAILVSAIISMVVGYIWYGPLFSKPWMKLMGFTQESMAAAKAKGVGKSYGIMFVGSLVMAYVLAHSTIFATSYTGTYGTPGGLMSGFWTWLGFVAPVTLGSVLWENKSWKLWFLNNGYYIITLCLMGMVLATWLPAK